ncbi:hypothetical protein Tco_1005001 [Tanacetum coccineum]|uniref:Uncharacterized protein n=1 Tax=Tanacetum coccineum TaxID=301880 RepID=A0ABQ5FE46_9ASTR
MFGLEGHRDRLPACLAHMLYCVVAEEQYNLAYFFFKRIECARATPTANLPYGMFLTRLYRYVMETYPHLNNGTYDIVERVVIKGCYVVDVRLRSWFVIGMGGIDKGHLITVAALAEKRTPNKPYTTAFEQSFQQYRRSETLVFSGDLSGKLSSPAVQQLWMMTNTQTPPPATTVVIPTGAPATNTVANHAERPEKFNGQNFKRWQQKMFFYLTTLGLARWLDSKNVISQVQDLQVLLHDIHAEGMTLSETFQVAAIIEKLPPSWVEFKNYLKHKRKEMSVEDLHAGSSSRFNSKGNKKDKKKNDKKGKGKSEYLAPKAGIVKQKF